MHVSRQVGEADFATGSHRDTQTYFYILPLILKCVFAYKIFVLDVIRLTINIGQYHSRRMRADRHTCKETDMQACEYACTHTHAHAYIHKYSYVFFSGYRKRPITHKEAKLSRTQRGLNSQSSDRGNIVSCQLSSTFDSRHRDCANKHSPKGGDNPSEINMFNIGIRTQCAMAQGNTETDKYTAFATNLITTCRLKPDMFSFWLW